MKALLIILFFLSILPAYSQAWCDAGANWKYSYMNGFGTEGYTEINYVGDTVINGQTAQKLDKHIYAYDYWVSQSVDFDAGMDFTYENNGVVYLLHNSSWDTLYNFNATIGDSWRMAKQPLMEYCDSNSILTVIATGTKIINSITLNYLVLDFSFPYSFTDTIVEKIGFISSYMFPYDGCDGVLDMNQGGPFRCYHDDTFTTYKPHYSEICDFIVGVEENTLNNTIHIVPNPAVSQIEIIGSLAPEAKLIIIDTYGKNWSIKENGNIIDVSTLPSGIYILSILQSNGVSRHKLIIN